MDKRALYDKISLKTSRLTTEAYSTSFSIGIRCLAKELRGPVYSIYGFVRFADEIVDTFNGFDQRALLSRFRDDTFAAIDEEVSLNPVLNSFQKVVNDYDIDRQLIHAFFSSMESDLTLMQHSRESLEQYVSGSAEAVGLMCLHIFTRNKPGEFESLSVFARKLGSAFQKVNFLRDLKDDIACLGRRYFPELPEGRLTASAKQKIEAGIEADFEDAYDGIRRLPRSSRFGVYVAYLYYRALFKKIKTMRHELVMQQRISLRGPAKISLLCYSYVRHKLNLI
jgi:phytoene synthase